MDTELTLSLIELILKHGPRAAIEVIKGVQASNVTPEQIRELKDIKPPEYYFGDSNDSA